ncbi:MAG: AarF/ABC1/UbiB kinase family protein [Deltaproteobacteria bacterium]|nr:AarF/ABC1/UbiB kinase family protein [Deltaproteobacteria bacterium]
MAKSPTQPSTLRFLIAYWITARILGSYLYLSILKKIFGKARLAGRIVQVHQRNARLLKASILHLKGLFIKVGQMVSIMTNFLPTDFTQELEGLQDAVPPSPYPLIEKRFQEEFGKTPLELFAQFETEPIASASLGQVHIARLTDGTKLAVKIQYPGIEKTIQSDLVILRRIFSLLHLFFPQYGLKKIYQEIKEVVQEELDFHIEASNLEKLRQNFKTEPDFLFPKVYPEWTRPHILTLEFMEGVKISNTEALRKLGLDPTVVAQKLLHAYCKQIFIDGLYHADPHPGNFLVQATNATPKIVFMDFGATATISEPMRKGIGKFFEGIIRRDNRIISQALKEMGFIAKTENEEIFDRFVEFFYDRIKNIKIDDLRNIKINLAEINHLDELIEFRKMDISLKELLQTFNIPKDWALLERTLIVLFGLVTHLDPKLNPLEIVIPYAEKFVLGKDRTLKDLLAEAVKELLLSYLKLPATLERTLKQLNKGELSLRIAPDKKGTKILARAVNQLTYALIILGSLGTAHVLKNELPLYIAYGFGCLFLLNFLRRN